MIQVISQAMVPMQWNRTSGVDNCYWQLALHAKMRWQYSPWYISMAFSCTCSLGENPGKAFKSFADSQH